MKIIYILKSFAQLAGVERVFADKMNYLANHNNSITLITYEQGMHPLAFPLHSSVKHKDINTRFFTLSTLPLFLRYYNYLRLKKRFRNRLRNIIKEECPDFIITTTYSLKIAKDILIANQDAKTIMESHISYASILRKNDFKKNSITRYMAMLYDKNNLRVLKQYDIFVTLTQQDATQWKQIIRNVIVIPNPVTKYPKTINLDKKSPHRIIAVGRLNHQKGFDKLIDAYSLISINHPSWHIDIFGKGELKESLCNQIKMKGLEDIITIHKPTLEIYEEYTHSDFYVLSSNFEGFCLVMLEAMACGLPCVSFDCPYGPKELIINGKNGLLVENGNIIELAEKIEWMITHENERREMAKEARNTLKQYKIEIIMSLWEELFQKSLK